MRYGLREIPAMLRGPLGSEHARFALARYGWPLLAPLAAAYRRTLARRTRVVVVVGSLGKTTTTRATIVALGGPDRPTPNRNAFSFVDLTVLGIRPGQRHTVIEVGIGARGQMRVHAGVVRPNVVVVTSIASDHRPRLGTLEATRHEKADMVRALSDSGLAVLNGDDEHVRWMATQTRARVVTYGFGEEVDVRASDYTLDWPHGSRLTLLARGQRRAVRTRLLGRHQIYPILAAVAVALEAGVSLDAILSRLDALAPTPHRLQLAQLPNGAYLVRDEYKASQETYEAALQLLAEIPAERRLVLLGEIDSLPDHEAQVYQSLGELIAGLADRAVIVAGQEASRAYADGACRAGMPPDALTALPPSWRQAADVLARELRAGDVALIKSGPFQRLDRVALSLQGRKVRCELVVCDAPISGCDGCPMLEQDWEGVSPSGIGENSQPARRGDGRRPNPLRIWRRLVSIVLPGRARPSGGEV